MKIEIRPDSFQPYDELQRFESEQLTDKGAFGAMASFVGTMRNSNEGDFVDRMVLEHYPGMTERALSGIGQDARQKWDVIDLLVLHRVGEVRPNDPIVLVAVWSKHRAAAFDACRYLMEELKSRVPFWKKEYLENGERWVDKNTPGYD